MTLLYNDENATPEDIAIEAGVIPVVYTRVQADGTEVPGAPTSGLASTSQLSSELARAVGGQGRSSQMTAENASTSLMSNPGKKTTDFRLTLRSKQTGDVVTFKVSPSIDESRAANYEHLAPVHHPGSIQVYKTTEARQFNITAKLVSRTAREASENLIALQKIRSWMMPYYGQGTANSSDSQKLGSPPDILEFNAYGSANISNIPVVLTSYHWVYPDNVDYIPSLDGNPFPTIIDVSLSVIESYSPEEYTSFDIVAYRSGDMVGAYAFSSTPKLPASEQVNISEELNNRAEQQDFSQFYNSQFGG